MIIEYLLHNSLYRFVNLFCFLYYLIFFDFLFFQADLLLINVVVLIYIPQKLCAGIAKRDGRAPWIGLIDLTPELETGTYQWSDGSAGEVYI